MDRHTAPAFARAILLGIAKRHEIDISGMFRDYRRRSRREHRARCEAIQALCNTPDPNGVKLQISEICEIFGITRTALFLSRQAVPGTVSRYKRRDAHGSLGSATDGRRRIGD
jgi:hypothetical protein